QKIPREIKNTISVIRDRLVILEGIRQRLTDSVETALELADGVVVVDYVDIDAHIAPEVRNTGEWEAVDDQGRAKYRSFSEKLSCPNGHLLNIDEIEPRSFSFNNPFVACSTCTGIGSQLQV